MGLTSRALARVSARAVLATATFLTGCECPRIQQDVYIATPDAMLAPLIEACRSGIPPGGQTCASSSLPHTNISCPCLPLCRRVMELIDQFSGDETLLSCQLLRNGSGQGSGGAGGSGSGGAGGAADTRPLSTRPDTVEVAVTYRPSTCE